MIKVSVLCCISILLLPDLTVSQENYSHHSENSYPKNVYWGDTHHHTNLSLDAFARGNKTLGLEESYRFAKGKSAIGSSGMKAQLQRPLDFLVIADHAFNMGVLTGLEQADPLLLSTSGGKRLFSKYQDIFNREGSGKKDIIIDEVVNDLGLWAWKRNDDVSNVYIKSIWEQVTATADRHNNPGKFTAFIGYEWSSMGAYDDIGNGYLHRVIIFSDDAGKANKILPFSTFDGRDPEDLWGWLESYQEETGGQVLAIPHNANISNGQVFSLLDFAGQPLDKEYAEMRSRWEPLFEVTQIKGDSESHPILSPEDPFSDYETWNSFNGRSMEGVETKGWILRKKSEYARSILKLGLGENAKLGVNPFKFGMIGSTDSHTSLAAVDENNFWGKFSPQEPNASRVLSFMWGKDISSQKNWELNAAGYAAVWAEENTRESLFSAMKRKEVYASTGPRMSVRFFGGWAYDRDDAFKPDLAKVGYDKGVPMGSDLTAAPQNESPSFLIHAVKDPVGGNLDRIQVIKGWRDIEGGLHEKVYDVALSDGRKIRRNKRVEPVGNTVNVKDASYTNTIGDPELSVVWHDPNFNRNEFAFYYVRVLEIPTPRWSAYDAKVFGIEDIPDEVPMVTQERVYTSPIWYTP